MRQLHWHPYPVWVPCLAAGARAARSAGLEWSFWVEAMAQSEGLGLALQSYPLPCRGTVEALDEAPLLMHSLHWSRDLSTCCCGLHTSPKTTAATSKLNGFLSREC
jgi:hypothetical protein